MQFVSFESSAICSDDIFLRTCSFLDVSSLSKTRCASIWTKLRGGRNQLWHKHLSTSYPEMLNMIHLSTASETMFSVYCRSCKATVVAKQSGSSTELADVIKRYTLLVEFSESGRSIVSGTFPLEEVADKVRVLIPPGSWKWKFPIKAPSLLAMEVSVSVARHCDGKFMRFCSRAMVSECFLRQPKKDDRRGDHPDNFVSFGDPQLPNLLLGFLQAHDVNSHYYMALQDFVWDEEDQETIMAIGSFDVALWHDECTLDILAEAEPAASTVDILEIWEKLGQWF